MDAVSQGRAFQRNIGPLATRAVQHARQPTCTALHFRALGACNSGNTGTAPWPGDHYESLRMSAVAAAAAAQIMASMEWAISRDSFQRQVTSAPARCAITLLDLKSANHLALCLQAC